MTYNQECVKLKVYDWPVWTNQQLAEVIGWWWLFSGRKLEVKNVFVATLCPRGFKNMKHQTPSLFDFAFRLGASKQQKPEVETEKGDDNGAFYAFNWTITISHTHSITITTVNTNSKTCPCFL